MISRHRASIKALVDGTQTIDNLRRESENASSNACKLNLRSMCAKLLEWLGMVSLYDSQGESIWAELQINGMCRVCLETTNQIWP